MLKPAVVEKTALTVVGLEATFIHALSPDATNFEIIPPLWDRFNERVNEVRNRMGHTTYGILGARPETERSHPDELRYLAGVAVGQAIDVPRGMVCRTVPAGTFAVFIHRGPIKNIAETAHEIYRIWLPSSGYRHAEIADVELYDQRFCVDGADSEMEYWISVVPKTSR